MSRNQLNLQNVVRTNKMETNFTETSAWFFRKIEKWYSDVRNLSAWFFQGSQLYSEWFSLRLHEISAVPFYLDRVQSGTPTGLHGHGTTLEWHSFKLDHFHK